MAVPTEMQLQRHDEGERYRFNYKGMHRYLITLLTFKSRKVFTEKTVVMSVLDPLLESCWKHHFDIYAYCFLPDRLVMIARGKTEYSDMKAFLATFKSSSSSALQPQLGHPLWKKKYLERVLRRSEDSKRIAEELFQLPAREGLVASAAEYQFKGLFVKGTRKIT